MTENTTAGKSLEEVLAPEENKKKMKERINIDLNKQFDYQKDWKPKSLENITSFCHSPGNF